MFHLQQTLHMDILHGNNANNGLTPQTPVQTMATAYSKLPGTGTTNSNIIVIMGSCTDTAYLGSTGVIQTSVATPNDPNYSKQATITGIYGGIDYHSQLSFGGTIITGQGINAKYLSAPTVFQYINLVGVGGSSPTNFYLQGNKMTFGEGVVMTNYPSVAMATDELRINKN